MLHPNIKKIAKKITSKGKGLFKIIHLSGDSISFKCSGNTFSFHVTNYPYRGCGEFAAGHVMEGEKYDLTFESDYKEMGIIKTASFIPYHISNTDNPDYILRNSLYFILGH